MPRVGGRDKACPKVSSIALTQYDTWLTGRGKCTGLWSKLTIHNQLFKSTQIIHNGGWIYVSKQKGLNEQTQWSDHGKHVALTIALTGFTSCPLRCYPACAVGAARHGGNKVSIGWSGCFTFYVSGCKERLGKHFERIFGYANKGPELNLVREIEIIGS